MTGPHRDPYAILGMPRGATRDQIASAYRRLAKAVHPDISAQASTDMRDLNWAWHVLSDSVRRGAWDAAHPVSGGHWRATREQGPSWSAAPNADVASAPWSRGGVGWTGPSDAAGRRSALGCVGLMVLAVLVAGLILIAALYPTIPGSVSDPADGDAEASEPP